MQWYVTSTFAGRRSQADTIRVAVTLRYASWLHCIAILFELGVGLSTHDGLRVYLGMPYSRRFPLHTRQHCFANASSTGEALAADIVSRT